MKTRFASLSVLCAVALSSGMARAQDAPRYRISRTVALGSPERWDYLSYDAPTHRVYVSHGDRITVVDTNAGAVIGTVASFPGGTHGIGISNATGRGYTDDGAAGQAVAFDLKTFEAGKRIEADADADGISVDPVTGHVFVVNGDTGTITVIDPKTNSAVATIKAGGKLEFAVAPGDGKLYVNGAGRKEILRIDIRTNAVDAHWPIPNCQSPHGLAADAAGRRLFSTCVNNLMVVVNMDNGKTVASLPIGAGTDAAAFDPKRKLAFSSNGRDGTLSVIQEQDPDTFVALTPVKTAITARTMALDPESGRIFLVAADIDTQVAAPAGSGPARPALVPGSTRLIYLDPVK